ncbi:hypothetical protein M0805_000153 [Coniferiporia weirii]|nr:hypothetical protein M0805_000153 [Coniferiporia weirii]
MEGLLGRGQLFLLFLCMIYLVCMGLLTIPYFQNHILYLHAVRWPLFADLNNPVRFGLPASRSANVQITTRDSVRLGAWLILPPSTPDSTPFGVPPGIEIISASLSAQPTILIFHGNAATRAVHFRVQHCTTYAARYKTNVLAIDYRGFGDSEGQPSEKGLISDARAAWDWVIERGAEAENILLVGMSLGTGVASALGAELAGEGIRPKGVVLLAPFTSIKALLYDYHLFGFIPVLQPLRPFPPMQSFLSQFLVTEFKTMSILHSIKAPILLAHSQDDREIPHVHSQSLFNELLDPLLPPVPDLPDSSELQTYNWTAYRNAKEARLSRKAELVQTRNISGFGSVHQLVRTGDTGDVMYVESLWGGHDRIGLQESLIDLIGTVFFPPSE